MEYKDLEAILNFTKVLLVFFGLSVDVQSVWPGNKQVFTGKSNEENTGRKVVI